MGCFDFTGAVVARAAGAKGAGMGDGGRECIFGEIRG